MNIPNPWITAECVGRGIAQASIPTDLIPSFAQFQEDIVMESLLARLCRSEGRAMSSIRYLEVGANHPIQTSNSYLLYAKHGARGTLVEANPNLIPALQKFRAGDRVLNLAVAPRPRTELMLHLAACSELSSARPEHIAHFGDRGRIVQTITVPAIDLDTLLVEQFPDGCDFAAIDIEGLDLDVVRDAQLVLVQPRFLMIEHNRAILPGNDEDIIVAATSKGYRLVAESPINLIFEFAV